MSRIEFSMTSVVNSLFALQCLPEGWDYGRNGPISGVAAQSAFQAAFWLHNNGHIKFDILPAKNNSAVILLRDGVKELEIYCRAQGYYDLYSFGSEDECNECLGVNLGELVAALEEMGWKSQRSFALCTLSSSHLNWVDTRAKHSTNLEMVLVYLSSARPALPRAGSANANTYQNFTALELAGHHLSSGEFRQRSYPMVTA